TPGPLSGAAERFAGRKALQHSHGCIAIPPATQSRADQEHRGKPRARRNAFSGNRRGAWLQGEQAGLYPSRAAVAPPFSSQAKRRRRGDAFRRGRISRSAGPGHLLGGGSRLCEKTLGPLVASSRRHAATGLTGRALATEWHSSPESSTAATRRPRRTHQCVAIVRQLAQKKKCEGRSGVFPETPSS